MRDPEVEEFLAHTRLASEDDAKADFERRVDVMREKLLASKGDEMKYSDDEPRDDHGRWGEGGAGPTTAEHFASRIVRTLEAKPNHVMDAVQLRATATRGVDSRFKSLYDQGHMILERAGAIKLVPGVAYPSYVLVPEKAQAFKTAAELDRKYSADQERDDHGRFGSADSMSTTALRNHINDIHLYSNPTIDSYGGAMGANRDRKVLLDYHSHLHEDNTDHSHDLVAAAREAVLAPPHPRIGLRDAPVGETKADPEHPDPRVPAGRKRDPKHPYDGTTLPE